MSQGNIDALLVVENAVKRFKIKVSPFKTRFVHALNNISIKIKEGKTLSLVGESGCGKTTLGKAIVGLYEIEQGRIFFRGKDITKLSHDEKKLVKRDIQIIFQDPFSSLNPRKKVRTILEQPLKIHTDLSRSERETKIEEICEAVGIDLSYLNRYPHQFSGGQRQRIAIARAIILNPALIVADEPVSALDVSIQAQILNLLMDLQEEYSLTYLFITHDISVVKHISDYVAVMYLGEIVEYGEKRRLFENPLHPYTRMLFSAVPDMNKPKLTPANLAIGEIPNPIDLPKGCFFASRCPEKSKRCTEEHPSLVPIQDQDSYLVRCYMLDEKFTK